MKPSNKIILLQIIFFSLFLGTVILPFIDESFVNLTFMKLDIFAYLFSFKFNILFIFLILIILIELLYGRIFCAFICPAGNLIAFFDWLFKDIREKLIYPVMTSRFFRKVRNDKRETIGKLKRMFTFIPLIIFIAVIVLKIFNLNITGFFDPLSIVHRFFTLTFQQFLKPMFRAYFNPVPVFVAISYSLIFIILLSFLGERVWCKYICPLGFVHRIISLKSRYVRIVKACSTCNRCVNVCPMDAIDIKNPAKYDRSLCILCFRCIGLADCNTIFKFQLSQNKYKRKRRDFLKLLTALTLLSFRIRQQKQKHKILRPPGATSSSINKNCLRCMECVRVCPTGVLQPISILKGLENVYTPEFRADLSYCDYECNLCGNICPNNSIQKLKLSEKKRWKVGVAKIDRTRCFVWNDGMPCAVCEEHCPVPEKAIKLVKIKKNGKSLLAPVVDENLCIGCAICQTKCPVPNSAINVIPIT